MTHLGSPSPSEDGSLYYRANVLRVDVPQGETLAQYPPDAVRLSRTQLDLRWIIGFHLDNEYNPLDVDCAGLVPAQSKAGVQQLAAYMGISTPRKHVCHKVLRGLENRRRRMAAA